MSHPPSLFVERGVYLAPYLSEAGEVIAQAIDSSGRRRLEQAVPAGVSVRSTVAALAQRLDEMDPA